MDARRLSASSDWSFLGKEGGYVKESHNTISGPLKVNVVGCQNCQVTTISAQTMRSDIRREPSAFAEDDGSGEIFQIQLELH